MSKPRIGSSTHHTPYPCSLLKAINTFLPAKLFAAGRSSLRWTERYLALCVILMAWSVSGTLADRFDDARRCLIKMFPGRRRPGKSYQGFAAALLKAGDDLLRKVAEHLRGEVHRTATRSGRWEIDGFVPIGVDGSKAECPKTAVNEAAFGCAGKKKSTPVKASPPRQQFVTTLLHLPTGVVWEFTHGPARSSERDHLRQMLPTLPANALLVADAGFTGYELLRAILDSGCGREFLIRVGSNVRLLRKLGFAVEERGQTVYLWPQDRRKTDPPLVLRLITLIDGRNRRMHLLSSVLEESKLSDASAARLYAMRWGIELHYRALKQTLSRRKLASDSPRMARAELAWSMVGLWLLTLLGVAALAETGHDPRSLSVAGALRRLRAAMKHPRRRHGRNGLPRQLAAARRDSYHRSGSKRARDWAHQKKPKPVGDPQARNATEAEVHMAHELWTQRDAA